MANIIIHNHGTVNIYEGVDHKPNTIDLHIDDVEIANMSVETARDRLLTKMYYARYKQTFGYYEGWLKLLDLYYSGNYYEMLEYINSCSGRCGDTRHKCKNYIKRIMMGGDE